MSNMATTTTTTPAEIDELRVRLAEAEETLRAIRSGEVDALVVQGAEGVQVYTLRGAEEPYRILVERMQEGALTVGPDGGIVYANRRFAELAGVPLEEASGRPLRAFIAEHQQPRFDRLLSAGGRAGRDEFDLLRSDGSSLPVLISLGVLPIEGVSAVAVIVTDLTEQKRRDELAASERFANAVVRQAIDVLLVCGAGGRIRNASGAAVALVGSDPVGRTLQEAFASPALAAAGATLRDYARLAAAGEVVQGAELRIERADGAQYYLLSSGPLSKEYDGDHGCVITMTDITARKMAEQHQQMLVGELSHRVKNLIAVVSTIATQSLSDHRPTGEARDAFLGRLHALSNTHSLLTDGLWRRAPLRDLVAREVAPFGARASVRGDEILLNAKAAQTLGLVLHELATNAAKYGALSVPEGRVDVAWCLDPSGEGPRFRLTWEEQGGPPVNAPTRNGFGQRLLEKAVTYDLKGVGELDFRGQGVRYTLEAGAETLTAPG